MNFEQCSGTYGSMQMVLPLFQPLRLWKPREEKVAVRTAVVVSDKKVSSLPKSFTMKGGYVNAPDGERRLMIAGRIFKAPSTLHSPVGVNE